MKKVAEGGTLITLLSGVLTAVGSQITPAARLALCSHCCLD